MPPKRTQVARPAGRPQQSSAAYIYHALQTPENFSVVKAVGLFGVAVTFFATGFANSLLDPNL